MSDEFGHLLRQLPDKNNIAGLADLLGIVCEDVAVLFEVLQGIYVGSEVLPKKSGIQDRVLYNEYLPYLGCCQAPFSAL